MHTIQYITIIFASKKTITTTEWDNLNKRGIFLAQESYYRVSTAALTAWVAHETFLDYIHTQIIDSFLSFSLTHSLYDEVTSLF